MVTYDDGTTGFTPGFAGHDPANPDRIANVLPTSHGQADDHANQIMATQRVNTDNQAETHVVSETQFESVSATKAREPSWAPSP
ncbi:MAG: hypothetical protein ABGX63_02605 [bacterium]